MPLNEKNHEENYNSLMKHLITLAFLTLFSIQSFAKAEVGMPAPIIEGRLLNGETISTSSLKGRVILVNFWASWCAPCREEMPLMENFYKRYKNEGFEILAISMDSVKDIPDAKKVMQSYSFLGAHKDELKLSEYGRIWRIPSTFIIDRDGTLVKHGLIGAPQVDEEMLTKLVVPLIKKH